MKKNSTRKGSTTFMSPDHSLRATTLMEEWSDDTKEYVGKVRKQKSKIVEAIKLNSLATESATTFTSDNIDAALAEIE